MLGKYLFCFFVKYFIQQRLYVTEINYVLCVEYYFFCKYMCVILSGKYIGKIIENTFSKYSLKFRMKKSQTEENYKNLKQHQLKNLLINIYKCLLTF